MRELTVKQRNRAIALISISVLLMVIKEDWIDAVLSSMFHKFIVDIILMLRMLTAIIFLSLGIMEFAVDIEELRQTEGFEDVVLGATAVVISLLIGGILVIVSQQNPIEGYYLMLRGSFGNEARLASAVTKVTPLILTGLSVAIAFRCGLFNIGAEGQLVFGAFIAAIVGIYVVGLPWYIHLTLCIAAGAIAGSLAAIIPAYLKAKVGAHEVVTTIMMNGIITAFTAWMVSDEKLLKNPATEATQTLKIQKSAELPMIWEKTPLEGINTVLEIFHLPFKATNFHYGLFIAIALAVLVYFIVWKTSLGYELRTVGQSPDAADYVGISTFKNTIYAMMISGALAGVGGAIEVLAIHQRFISGFSPGYGFDGIAVAVLGQNNSIGVLISALLFGALAAGGLYIDILSDIPKEIVWVLKGLVVLFVSAPLLIKRTRIVEKLSNRGTQHLDQIEEDSTMSVKEQTEQSSTIDNDLKTKGGS